MNATSTRTEITTGDLTPGTWVEGVTTGRNFSSTWAGIYDGQRPSQHDGVLYHYFRDGHINGTAQSLHGLPVAHLNA